MRGKSTRQAVRYQAAPSLADLMHTGRPPNKMPNSQQARTIFHYPLSGFMGIKGQSKQNEEQAPLFNPSDSIHSSWIF